MRKIELPAPIHGGKVCLRCKQEKARKRSRANNSKPERKQKIAELYEKDLVDGHCPECKHKIGD